MITRLRQSVFALPVILAAFTIHIAVTTFCCLPSVEGDGADGWNAAFLCLNGASNDDAGTEDTDPHEAHKWCGCLMACGGDLSPPLSSAFLTVPIGEQHYFPIQTEIGPPESRPTSFFLSRGPPTLSA